MKISTKRAFILAVCVVVIMLIAGCEEQNLARKSRLIAAENIRLKEQLEQYEVEVEKQKGLLAKCLQEKKFLQKVPRKDFQEQMDSILTTVIKESRKARQENEKLKAQLEKLKVELEELKKPGLQPLPSTPNSL